MTMTNGRKPPTPPPNPMRPPPPAGHNTSAMHDEFSSEAARAAQRYYEMVQQITQLTADVEEWRARAISAEKEITRAEQRERDLSTKLERVSDRLTAERDTYKDRLTTLKAEFSTAGNIILHCIKVSEMMGADAPGESPGPEAPRLDMQRLADEIGEVIEGDDRLPRVITAGPRTPES
jgi:hypothetical protein